jgi:hypothetical protein
LLANVKGKLDLSSVVVGAVSLEPQPNITLLLPTGSSIMFNNCGNWEFLKTSNSYIGKRHVLYATSKEDLQSWEELFRSKSFAVRRSTFRALVASDGKRRSRTLNG